MKAMKFWIGNDPELSRHIQTILFKLGYKWSNGKVVSYKVVSHTDRCTLYTDEEGTILCGKGSYQFNDDPREEINIDWMRLANSITISDDYEGIIHEDGSLKVGCQTIDFETIEKVYELAKSKRS